jgi:hypothetical protein
MMIDHHSGGLHAALIHLNPSPRRKGKDQIGIRPTLSDIPDKEALKEIVTGACMSRDDPRRGSRN